MTASGSKHVLPMSRGSQEPGFINTPASGSVDSPTDFQERTAVMVSTDPGIRSVSTYHSVAPDEVGVVQKSLNSVGWWSNGGVVGQSLINRKLHAADLRSQDFFDCSSDLRIRNILERDSRVSNCRSILQQPTTLTCRNITDLAARLRELL